MLVRPGTDAGLNAAAGSEREHTTASSGLTYVISGIQRLHVVTPCYFSALSLSILLRFLFQGSTFVKVAQPPFSIGSS